MILIFDYFETLLTSKRVDFNQGLKVFWERYYKDRCQFEEIKAYGEELFLQLLSMHAEGKEYPFVEAELPLYAQRFGGDVVSMDAEEEADFLMSCNEFEPCPGVESFLKKCSQRNIPMYVLSNSGFRADALKLILERMGIGKYFVELWSSADFGRIKPCREFFELAIRKALDDNLSEDRENIIFIGDLYETDVIGAYNAGIKAAWLNKSGGEDLQNIVSYNVSSISELADLLNIK